MVTNPGNNEGPRPAGRGPSSYVPPVELSISHAAYLADQAIKPDVARRAGVRTVSKTDEMPPDLRYLDDTTGILFPWTPPAGTDTEEVGEEPRVEYQFRPDNPPKDKNGRPKKYIFRSSDSGYEPVIWEIRAPSDDRALSCLVEGTKQALAVASHAPAAYGVYALAGCHQWQNNGEPTEDLKIFSGRRVRVMLDADSTTNLVVYQAGVDLREALLRDGAKEVQFPRALGRGTEGIDDVLARTADEDREPTLRRVLTRHTSTKPAPKKPNPQPKDGELLLPPPDQPLEVARALAKDPRFLTDDGSLRLRTWNDEWIWWTGGQWQPEAPNEVRRRFRLATEHAVYQKTKASGEVTIHKWSGTTTRLHELMAAWGDVHTVHKSVRHQGWFHEDGTADRSRDGSAYLSVANGLLRIQDRSLFGHDPHYLTVACSPHEYNPEAPEPTQWYQFLDSLWGPDSQETRQLRKILGYLLSGRTDLQRFFLLTGAAGSGKSTLVAVITELLGEENVGSLAWPALSTDFGLQTSIGKTLISIPDGQLPSGKERDTARAAILSISGEDHLTINRKYRDPWTGRLPARLLLVGNKVPVFGDNSSAVERRMVALNFTKTFTGREDHQLVEKLRAEMPGILNWALEGLEQLKNDGGRFETLSSVSEIIRDTYGRERRFAEDVGLVEDPAGELSVDAVYQAWWTWCHEQGDERPGSVNAFGRSLRTVFPGMGTRRQEPVKGQKIRYHTGINWRYPSAGPDLPPGDTGDGYPVDRNLQVRGDVDLLSTGSTGWPSPALGGVLSPPVDRNPQVRGDVDLLSTLSTSCMASFELEKEKKEEVEGCKERVESVPQQGVNPGTAGRQGRQEINIPSDLRVSVDRRAQNTSEGRSEPSGRPCRQEINIPSDLQVPVDRIAITTPASPTTGESIILDLETGSADQLHVRPGPGQPGFIRLAGTTGPDDEDPLVTTTNPTRVIERITATTGKIIGHNLMAYDLPALEIHHRLDTRNLVESGRVVDTLLLARHIDPPMAREKGVDATHRYNLDALATKLGYLGKTGDLKYLAKKHGGYDQIPVDDPEYVSYLQGDLTATRAVARELLAQVGNLDQISRDYLDREHRVAYLASRIEVNGFRVDLDLLRQRRARVEAKIAKSVQWLVDNAGLPVVSDTGDVYKSPVSTKAGKRALGQALIDAGAGDIVLPTTSKTEALNTSRSGLMSFLAEHEDDLNIYHLVEIVDHITTVTGARSIYHTITDHLVGDRVHPAVSMQQASGRWSLTNPGLTVLGKRAGRHVEREVFLPEPGHVILAFDLSQVDMRAIAGLSQDQAYIDMLRTEDPHAEIARTLFGDVSYRETAKAIGHGWNYGESLARISGDHNIEFKIVQEFETSMYRRFPRLVQWREEVRESAAAGDLLDNGFGRRMRPDPQRAHTQGPALMGQGGARDILMEGLLRLPHEVHPLIRAVVHDEVVLSVPATDVDDVSRTVLDALQFEWRGVPIEAGCTPPGASWGGVYAK